ncbi:MAG: hypothetical protein GF331_02875, partial [Chitinivibrionales bacterium]|nr:hypothetical protein [Chitinivibrionales bacterium]
MLRRVLLTAFVISATVGIASPVGALPPMCKGLEQADTLLLYARDEKVGTFAQHLSVDRERGGMVESAELQAQVAGAPVRISEHREYDEAGGLVSATQSIATQAGTNRWELVTDSAGSARIRAVIGGQTTERDVPAQYTERADVLCSVYRGIRDGTVRAGDSWRDTSIELMSGRLVTTTIACVAAPADRGRDTWEFSVTEDQSGHVERWVVDTRGRTLLRSMPPLFVARRAGYEGGSEGTTPVDFPDVPLTELFRASKSRAARENERIALRLADGVGLHESVKGLY